MKLSTAIREGAKLRPQYFEGYFGHIYPTEDSEGILCSCALGAAWEYARNQTFCHQEAEQVLEYFGIIDYIYICPASNKSKPLSLIITELNDDHLWTREQIADYVESLGY